MQLDKTRIAIRERGVLDTMDLALHVLRAYLKPLLITMAIGVIPLAIVNWIIAGWMISDLDNEMDYPFRYVWHMSILIFIEAQIASIFATAFLGQAVFLDQPSIREVFRDVLRMMPRIIWCQLLMRGVLPAFILVIMIDPLTVYDPFVEGFVAFFLIAIAAILRAARPFLNEIVLLERNPLVAKKSSVITVGRRSKMLHNIASGDLVVRWIGSAVVGIGLALSVYGFFIFLSGVFANDWNQGWVLLRICFPASLWLVCLYMAVFRFLSYLDLRIRQEGWEVELQLRAEATRMQGTKIAVGEA